MRAWRIIEDGHGDMRFRGEKDEELREAFEMGCEHGYKKAKKEMYGERVGYPPRINFHDEDEFDDDFDDYMERRGVRGTGRYSRYRR